MSEVDKLITKIRVWQTALKTYENAYGAYSDNPHSLELASATEKTKDALDNAAIDAFDVRHNTERLYVATLLVDEIMRLRGGEKGHDDDRLRD